MARRVLVTGATGRAGRGVLRALLAAKLVITATFWQAPGADADEVDWRQTNFLEHANMEPLVEGCDAVVHFAAELGDVERMERVNVDATRALAAAAERAGVRYFGHASSVVVYGSPRVRDVDEETPRLDPSQRIEPQYFAEPYMRAYARSKARAELALEELAPAMRVEIYRPTVFANLDRLIECRDWSLARRMFAQYRRTQYMYAPDAAAAIAHLVLRGIEAAKPEPGLEAYNICDEACGTFRDVFAAAYARTGDVRYRAPPDVPMIGDLVSNAVRHGGLSRRYPFGMLNVSAAKLRATGFVPPVGVPAALELALRRDASSA